MRVLFLFIQLGIISSHLAFAENTNSTQEWTITQHGPVLLMSIENRGGSAFLIKDNQHTLVVSNVHVVSGLMKGRDTLPPNIQIIGLDLLHDLVVLKIKGKFEDSEVLTLADSPLEANSQLTAIGFPKGRFSRIQGRLLPYDYDPNIKYMMTNFNDLGGASGSPILNSEQQVIGILSIGTHNLAVFTSVDALKKLLSQAPLNCEWKECFNNELTRLHQLAETDPFAQYTLEQLHLGSNGDEHDKEKAIKLIFALATTKGHTLSQYLSSGILWQEGNGGSKNITITIYLLEQVVEQEFAPAMYQLSIIIQERRSIISKLFENLSKIFPKIGVPTYLKKAFELMLAAAKQRYSPAMVKAGIMYRQGIGVPQDLQQAKQWFLAAAEQGDPNAMVQLGFMYLQGIGVPKNLQQTKQWFLAAADLGDPAAMVQLGFMYRYGIGVPKNLRQAIQWFLAATEQEDPAAMFQLGIMYRHGIGLPKNHIKANRWLELASNKKYHPAPTLLEKISKEERREQTGLIKSIKNLCANTFLGGKTQK